MSIARVVASCLIVAVAAACAPATQAPDPIVIQGAMPVETQELVAALANPAEQQVQGWTFWTGTLDGHPVVVSKTQKGMANAGAATALAIERFHPRAIVNQGTAGGHDPVLRVSDIVIGTAAVNIGAFKTGTRGKGDGSDFTEWQPMDLIRTEGSAGQDPNAWMMRRFAGDTALLAAANSVKDRYRSGRVVEGVIGSSDVWNSELDRIQRLHDEYGTTVEEMETSAAAQVAGMSRVPFLGIRVLSNNITNGGTYDNCAEAPASRLTASGIRRRFRGETERMGR
jgi:adenosylhomocysteine nucleosidase